MHSSKTALNLSKPEIVLYVITWTSAVLFAVFSFALTGQKFFQHYVDDFNDFTKGWRFLLPYSSKRDASDFEWETFKFLVHKLYLWMVIFLIVSELFRKRSMFLALKLWQISITTVIITKELGVLTFAIITLQPCFFIFVIIKRCKHVFLLWMFNGVVLLFISSYKILLSREENLVLLGLDSQQAYISMLILFWTNLRCFSFCVETCPENVKGKSILDLFCYCFYLPTVFCGPFIPYDHFKTVYSNNTSERLEEEFLKFLLNLSRFYFWMIFTDFCLHFVYVNATSFHPEWVQSLDSWSLYGYGYAMGQFFHLKYFVIYGLSTSLAKFEGVKVPSLPVCIGRIYLYSDMWKYFDVGLYTFLLRYIYIPSLKSQIVKNRMVSSFMCFSFIYVWHGTETYILIWTVMNYFGILIENLCKEIYRKFGGGELNSAWMRRIACALCAPLLALSAMSNFYFFARVEIGNIFLHNFVHDKLSKNIILFLVLYCCCQVSWELRRKQRGTEFKKRLIL